MKFSFWAWVSRLSRISSRSLCAVSCAIVSSAASADWIPSATVDLPPDLTSTGYAVIDVAFSTGGWAPEAIENAVDPNGPLVPVYDFSPQLLAILAAQRQTNALLWQAVFLQVCFAVGLVGLSCFKAYNHFIGYEGSARKR